uniref:Uncharacterized protein n=1 Tax=Coccidioides posadasii RMSCC 3488 TaxID=454284 RepID=A0A0J6FP11_COCPO|nr:hypothetical protein CPAG_07482 [Coccidioides posadasii RMSCC 3488]
MASVCAFTNWPVREYMGALKRQQPFLSVNPSFQKETHTFYNISDLPVPTGMAHPGIPRRELRYLAYLQKLLCASVKPCISTEHGVTNGWTRLRAPIMRHFRATGDYQSPTSSHKNFTIIGHIVPPIGVGGKGECRAAGLNVAVQPGRGREERASPIPSSVRGAAPWLGVVAARRFWDL